MKKLACPRCAKDAPFSAENPWRPFCSERCKMVDLGLWASESYRVPEQDGGTGPEADFPETP